MVRDEEALRAYLVALESSSDWSFRIPGRGVSDGKEERAKLYVYHLLCDQGYLAPISKYFFRMTAQGHDFLDATRDEGVWAKTKAVVAEQGGSVTLEMMKSVAMAFVRKQIEDRTGLSI